MSTFTAEGDEQFKDTPFVDTPEAYITCKSILRKTHWQAAYPFEHMTHAAQKKLVEVAETLPQKHYAKILPTLFRIFECYLAVTKQTLDYEEKSFSQSDALVDFLGAIFSGRFLYASKGRRYTYATIWLGILRLACPHAINAIPKPRTNEILPWYIEARRKFESKTLNSREVDIWHGWTCLNGQKNVKWYDLRDIYLRFGKQFADDFWHGLVQFYAGRKAQDLPLVQQFAHYLGALPADWSRDKFLSGPPVSGILLKFAKEQLTEFGERDCQYSTFRDRWVDFSYFVRHHLCNGRLFARHIELVKFENTKTVDVALTHRRVDAGGKTVIRKLLTDVPLYLSNKEAAELLFNRIEADKDYIVNWANYS